MQKKKAFYIEITDHMMKLLYTCVDFQKKNCPLIFILRQSKLHVKGT